jgi:hypothetical protein
MHGKLMMLGERSWRSEKSNASMQRNSKMTLEKFEEKRAGTNGRTFYCLKEQKTSKMFLLRLSLERAVSEAKFFKEFFVSLDFFFVTFFCIKTKESKIIHQSCSRKPFFALIESVPSEYFTLNDCIDHSHFCSCRLTALEESLITGII